MIITKPDLIHAVRKGLLESGVRDDDLEFMVSAIMWQADQFKLQPISVSKDVKEVQELCEKATPGPWRWVKNKFRDGYSGIEGANGDEVLYPDHCNESDCGAAWFYEYPTEADGKFMVDSRTLLPQWVTRFLEALNG